MTAAHDDRHPDLEEWDVVITVAHTYRIRQRATGPGDAWNDAAGRFADMPEAERDAHYEGTRERVQVFVTPPSGTNTPRLSVVS